MLGNGVFTVTLALEALRVAPSDRIATALRGIGTARNGPRRSCHNHRLRSRSLPPLPRVTDRRSEVGWSVERLSWLSTRIGYEAAHAEWEVALAHAVERLIEGRTDAVIGLGAGHTHLTSPPLFARVRVAVGSAERVILLRPATDPASTVAVLRQRSIASKGHDWRGDGIDWLERWTTDGHDEPLATDVVYNGLESPAETVRRLDSVLSCDVGRGRREQSGES